MKKRILALLLAAAMALSCLMACGREEAEMETTPETVPFAAPMETAPAETAPATREFTDSTGRTVTLPGVITKIAITGPLSQVYILPLAGDMLVGVCNDFAQDIQMYLPDYVLALPQLGQLYGGKGEMDLEALLAAAPEVVIDVGDAKDSMAGDLEALTQQTCIPFLHIDATVSTSPRPTGPWASSWAGRKRRSPWRPIARMCWIRWML